MEYGMLALLVLGGSIFFMKLNELEKQVKIQQVQIDNLCKVTGYQQLASDYISDQDRAEIVRLKNDGRTAEAIKKVRELTSMSLLQAKKYVDKL